MKKNNVTHLPLNIDFFSFFVHELKAPLMHLKWRIEQLKKAPASHTILAQIEKDCDRLFQMIQDGLDMKQLEHGSVIKPKWHSWKELVDHVQFLLQDRLKAFDLKLHITGEWKQIEVYMDSLWVRSVLMNVINNAIQFSPKGSQINLDTRLVDENQIIFSVTDEGMGISEDKKDKVFEYFYTSRASSSDRPLDKGTGLGLYIARSVVKAHEGSITVKSNHQNTKGCTLLVTLPKARKITYSYAS